jgi:hypothetical protein
VIVTVIQLVTIKRKTHIFNILFWLTVFTVLTAQFVLCFDAIVCRGWPPLTENGMYKLWGSPFLVWIPAVFTNRVTRFRGLAVMTFGLATYFSMISVSGVMTPSIGHLTGVTGLIRKHFVEILFTSTMYSPFVFTVTYFVERVFGDLWRALWLLPSETMTFAETWHKAWRICARA